jgi:hypothetical protein
MVSSIAFNPVVTTNAPSTFLVQTTGYIQGTAQDDPATRFQLSGGILASTETLPMWGGVGISEAINNPSYSPTTPAGALGNVITRATTMSAGTAGVLTGFSVFDQDWSMINFPQSPVPLAASGMEVNYYRLGSNQRIVVACDPGFAATLVAGGVPTTKAVMWDFTGQEVVDPATFGSGTITNAVWNNTSGGQVVFSTTLTGVAVDDTIDVSGIVSAPVGVFNGSFSVVAVNSGTSITVAYPEETSPGTYTSGGTIAASTSNTLPIRGVLDVNIGNSMTVDYNSATGFATWNYAGTTAVILL